MDELNIKNSREIEEVKIKTNMSEVGVITMAVQGNNALKIEDKIEEKSKGFQIKVNKFDVYFGIIKNEERELEIKEKKIKSYQNLKAVQADREKIAVKFLGDL